MEKTTYQRALCSLFLTKYHSGGDVKKTEMGRACSINGASRGVYKLLVGNSDERTLRGRPRS